MDNGDTLTYTATKADGNDLPTWMGFTGSTRTFVGTPQAADVETLAVKVTASDGTASVSDEFNIEVSVTDTTPPTLVSAVVESHDMNRIEFTFDEFLQHHLPLAAAFTVTVDGIAFTVTRIGGTFIIGGNFVGKFSVYVSPRIPRGQTVVVTYTDPTAVDDAMAIQDTAGNDVATFTTGEAGVPAVTNNRIIPMVAPTVANANPDSTATAGTHVQLYASASTRSTLATRCISRPRNQTATRCPPG